MNSKLSKHNISSFAEIVYRACQKIPKGKVSTYQEIARVIGNPKSYRAVGNALHRNPFAPQVPCHRVVRTDGVIGDFASGRNNKIKILRREGIKIQSGRIVAMDQYFYRFK